MKCQKRSLSLIEIMIAIFIITLVTGAIGYNMRGTLDRGRAFRTEQAMELLHDQLLVCLADGVDPEALARSPEEYLQSLGLAKDPKNLVLDGWKAPFVIRPTRDRSDFIIRSEALNRYKQRTRATSVVMNEENDSDSE